MSAPLDALSRALDARVNLKHVHRRLEVAGRVLIVVTFFEPPLWAVRALMLSRTSFPPRRPMIISA